MENIVENVVQFLGVSVLIALAAVVFFLLVVYGLIHCSVKLDDRYAHYKQKKLDRRRDYMIELRDKHIYVPDKMTEAEIKEYNKAVKKGWIDPKEEIRILSNQGEKQGW